MKKLILLVIISAFSFGAGYQIADNKTNNLLNPTENICPYLNNDHSNAKSEECPYLNNENKSENKCPYSDGKLNSSKNKLKVLKIV